MSADAIPQAGEKLDHYQLEELLAVGGMGLVFRAYDAPLDRYVAVKVLAPELAADEQIATQFVIEARAMATLSHPNVVHVYSVGQDRGLLYFAMEWVQGDNLETLQQDVSQLNINEAVQLIHQAALGLQHAHRRGILHGDVKPANLVVTFAGVLKVTDFGLARRVTVQQANDYGTPEYSSPETLAGKPTDHRSDIYALGATFYHLLAGRPPFAGTPEQILHHQRRERPAPVTKFNLQVAPTLNRVVMRCLEKDPVQRYQSYEELVSDLEQVIGAQPKPARKPTSARPGFVVALLAALVLSGLGLYLWKRAVQPAPPAPPPARRAAPPAKVVTQRVAVVSHGSLSAAEEALAEQAASSLKSQADELLRAGKLAEAQAIYQQWPLQPLHVTAKANHLILEQRKHILQLAMIEWRQHQQQADEFVGKKEFDAASSVCEQAIQKLKQFPKCVALAQDELDRIRTAQRQHAATQASQQAALEKQRLSRLNAVRDEVSQLVVNLEWDKVLEHLRAASQETDPEMQLRIQQLHSQEVEPLLLLRARIQARAKANHGPSLTMSTRSGEIEGQLLALESERVTLGRVLTHGVISTPVAWDSVLPLSRLRFFAACHQADDNAEQYGFALLLSHFALARLARLEDARRELRNAVQRDPARAPLVQPFLDRLQELERRLEQETALRIAAQAKATRAQLDWSLVESAYQAKDPEAVLRELAYFLQQHKDSECARQHRSEIEQLQRSLRPATEPLAKFEPVDFGRVPRTALLQGVDGPEAQNFDERAMFVTSGYLRQQGIGRHGLPDDGQIIVRLADQRVPLQIKGAEALLLGSEHRRYAVLPVRGRPGKYTQLAILFAAAQQSTDFELTVSYAGGQQSVFEFRIWDWRYQPESGDRNLAVVAVTASDKSRVTLGARLFNLDASQKLEQIRLRIPQTRDNQDAVVAILGIALLPAP